jgi:sec-independent protein translocase protein TatA
MPGPSEMAIILVIVLIFFGAGKLPEVFASFGEGMKRFREAQRDDPKDVTPRKPQIAGEEEAEEVAEADEVKSKSGGERKRA